MAAQVWDTAASVAAAVVGGVLADPPSEPVVLNVNVPNLLEEVKGWRWTEVGTVPPRAVTGPPGAQVRPRRHVPGGDGVRPAHLLPAHLDGGAVMDGYVALSRLSRLVDSGTGPRRRSTPPWTCCSPADRHAAALAGPTAPPGPAAEGGRPAP